MYVKVKLIHNIDMEFTLNGRKNLFSRYRSLSDTLYEWVPYHIHVFKLILSLACYYQLPCQNMNNLAISSQNIHFKANENWVYLPSPGFQYHTWYQIKGSNRIFNKPLQLIETEYDFGQQNITFS